MEIVLAEIAQEVDLVIIDSPPVLAVTDSAVLASKVDGVILLVEAKRTSHDAARHAQQALQSVDANILGGVLTKVKIPHGHSSYYYYSRREQLPRSRMLGWWHSLLSAFKKRRRAASKRTDWEGWQTERETVAYRDD
jgi:Mrp family chromosome partitioning ATPase